MTFALVLPPVCLLGVGAIEISEVVKTKAQLQSIVDSAALKGASELAFDQSLTTQERTRAYADGRADVYRNLWSISTTAQSDPNWQSMTAVQDAIRPSFFGSLLPPGGWRLHVTATATQNAKKPLCVLALQAGNTQVVHLSGTSAISAPGCAVQSDSDVQADTGATLSAGAVRTVGNATGSISPAPVTDAPSIADPFASLPINVPSTCDDNDLKVNSGTQSLNPGVHCGAISIKGNGNLVLNPGEHYFVNGTIEAKGNGAISGTDVVLIFKGEASMQFKGNASLSFEGRQSGPFAGFVLITDRSFTGTVDISTTSAHRLLGTIYLPNAVLAVSGGKNNVADQSPWTIVVAQAVTTTGQASLVINASYAAARVPVPGGVGPNALRIAQ